MAAHRLAITAISSVLSEHLDVINETNLYKTCSAIHTGNRGHLDVLALLRSHHLGALTPVAEGQIYVPPLYQVCLEVCLSCCTMFCLSSSQILTEREPVAGYRSNDQHSTSAIIDPATFPKNATASEEVPVGHFVASRRTRWECIIIFSIMVTLCISSCWDIFIDTAHC